MKYDLSSFHILVEDWAETKDLIHRQREWLKKNNKSIKDIHDGNKPREFKFNGTAEDYYKQRNKVVDPLSAARDDVQSLRFIVAGQGYDELAKDKKIVDKLKTAGGLPEGIKSISKQIAQYYPATYGLNKATTKFTGNNIAYNTAHNITQDIIDHEREHAKQAGTAYKIGGNKAVAQLDRNYQDQNEKSMYSIDNDRQKYYFGNPMEYHANRAGIGKPPTERQRENMVRTYLNRGNTFADRYTDFHKDNAKKLYEKVSGVTLSN